MSLFLSATNQQCESLVTRQAFHHSSVYKSHHASTADYKKLQRVCQPMVCGLHFTESDKLNQVTLISSCFKQSNRYRSSSWLSCCWKPLKRGALQSTDTVHQCVQFNITLGQFQRALKNASIWSPTAAALSDSVFGALCRYTDRYNISSVNPHALHSQ